MKVITIINLKGGIGNATARVLTDSEKVESAFRTHTTHRRFRRSNSGRYWRITSTMGPRLSRKPREPLHRKRRPRTSSAGKNRPACRSEPMRIPIRSMTLDKLAHFLSEWKAFGNGDEIKVWLTQEAEASREQ